MDYYRKITSVVTRKDCSLCHAQKLLRTNDCKDHLDSSPHKLVAQKLNRRSETSSMQKKCILRFLDIKPRFAK